MTNPPKGTYDCAEILWEKPLAEDFPEFSFGPENGNALWILFSESLGPGAWIGKFGCGDVTSMKVRKVGPETFFVNSGGIPYLVRAGDPSLTKPLLPGCRNPYRDVAFDPSDGTVVVGGTGLRAFRAGAELWCIDRISRDPVRDLEIVDGVLTGMRETVSEGTEETFRFDLGTRTFL